MFAPTFYLVLLLDNKYLVLRLILNKICTIWYCSITITHCYNTPMYILYLTIQIYNFMFRIFRMNTSNIKETISLQPNIFYIFKFFSVEFLKERKALSSSRYICIPYDTKGKTFILRLLSIVQNFFYYHKKIKKQPFFSKIFFSMGK